MHMFVCVLCYRWFSVIMAMNSNADAVLFDHLENEVLGFNSIIRSNVNVGGPFSETLITDVGGGTNGSMDTLSVSEGKVGKFSCGLVKNEDEKSVIQCSDGGAMSDQALVFELNDGVQVEQERKNVEKVALSNKVERVEDDVSEREQENEAKNVALRVVVEDDGVLKAADSFVAKDDTEDSRVSDVATCQLQDGIPYVEGMDVKAEESSNQTTYINISGAGIPLNTRYDYRGLDLVVDLNSNKNTQEDSVPRESVFYDVNYCVSDLVWGKVRGHPWWPGQIYDPSVASEKARMHRKENCYLIAYFGDQTFAWNEVSMIKPFNKHFTEMEKQNDLEIFRHAVDCALEEASRRVEFGLSCPCMPGEASPKLKTQLIANAAASFEPLELVNFVKSLAQSPLAEFDRLEFVNAHAQLSAFYCSKGYSQLPEFAMLDRLFENDMEILPVREKQQCNDQINEQVLMKTHEEFSRKPQHISRNTKQTGKKKKLLSDLMSEKNSWTLKGECTPEKKADDNSISPCVRKQKAAHDTNEYFHHSQIADDKSTSQRGTKRKACYDTSGDDFHNYQIAGNNSTPQRGRKRKAAYNAFDDCSNNSQTENYIQLQNVSVDDMQSQLCLAAKDPAGESCSSDMIYFFSEFEKFTGFNDSVFLEQGLSLEQEHGGETGVVISTEAAATSSMSTPTPMELCNDSYWTDRIIQSISEEDTLLKNQNERDELLPAAEISPDLDLMHQETNRNLGSEPSNHVEHVNESFPTSLTLKFTNLDSVPSTTDLNKIFGRFGTLIESKTKLLEKTNRARVVFERYCDAETAFSSAGKYSIFGPSLQSYRLKILPRTPKKGTGKRGRKSKKEKSSVDAATV